MAKLRGAHVAVVGLPSDSARMAIAQDFGCETIVDSQQAMQWSEARDGLGADGVVDAAGVSATLKLAVDAVRPGGWISKVGWGRAALDFSLDPLVQKNVQLQGSFSHTWAIWERVLVLLASGDLDVAKIVGGTWQLENWHTAFEEMHSGRIAKSVLVNFAA
jgi:alcohol dehydrogenase/L-iditol 2-dehydrogenase